jgi:acyl transferase domain-containing protein
MWVSIAAINGEDLIVISGESNKIADIMKIFEKEYIWYQENMISHAFHSPLSAKIIPSFKKEFLNVKLNTPIKQIISNVTGNLVKDEMLNSDYWCMHLKEPVRFVDNVKVLYKENCSIFIEIGPDATLLTLEELLPDDVRKSEISEVSLMPSLLKNENNNVKILKTLKELFLLGVDIKWENVQR